MFGDKHFVKFTVMYVNLNVEVKHFEYTIILCIKKKKTKEDLKLYAHNNVFECTPIIT